MVFAVTATVKKLFPEKVNGIVTIAIALAIGLLTGLIVPSLGIGVGVFAGLVAITGATLADRVGEAIEPVIVAETVTEAPKINDSVRYVPVVNLDKPQEVAQAQAPDEPCA